MLHLLIAIVIGVLLAGGAYATSTVLNARPDSATVYSYGGS